MASNGRAARKTAHPKKRALLAAISRTGNRFRACLAAKVGRTTLREWLENDEEFQGLFDQAMEEAAERMEFEARRRAERGTLKPVFQGGRRVGVIREYSDTLLIFLLKGALPEKYRERQDTNLHLPDFSKFKDEELLAAREKLRRLRGEPGGGTPQEGPSGT